jgi:hypothetical protein
MQPSTRRGRSLHRVLVRCGLLRTIGDRCRRARTSRGLHSVRPAAIASLVAVDRASGCGCCWLARRRMGRTRGEPGGRHRATGGRRIVGTEGFARECGSTREPRRPDDRSPPRRGVVSRYVSERIGSQPLLFPFSEGRSVRLQADFRGPAKAGHYILQTIARAHAINAPCWTHRMGGNAFHPQRRIVSSDEN